MMCGHGPPFQSPESGLLYFIRNGGVWSVPLDGGQEREIFHFDLLDGAILQADRTGIYFIAQRKGTAFQEPGDLMFYHFPSGPITEVGLQGRYGFSLSPDGHHLLYTKFAATGSDLMVVDRFR